MDESATGWSSSIWEDGAEDGAGGSSDRCLARLSVAADLLVGPACRASDSSEARWAGSASDFTSPSGVGVGAGAGAGDEVDGALRVGAGAGSSVGGPAGVGASMGGVDGGVVEDGAAGDSDTGDEAVGGEGDEAVGAEGGEAVGGEAVGGEGFDEVGGADGVVGGGTGGVVAGGSVGTVETGGIEGPISGPCVGGPLTAVSGAEAGGTWTTDWQ